MFGKLILLFVGVPLLELALLVQLGTRLGFWPTMGLVLLTGVLGAALARTQGARVIRTIQAELAAGRVPASHLLDGLLILLGGVVLLTPGVLTDVAGIVLLIPFTRNRLKEGLRRRFERMVRSGEVRVVRLL